MDYYPFGMTVPNRSYSSPLYRYGFQGQEKDDEIKGEGNSLNYTFRMHDPRVGRFFAVDPLFREYSELTPYQFSSNAPIHAKELEGKETGFDFRFSRRERAVLSGKMTPKEFQEANRAEGMGAIIAGAALLTYYTGGRAAPLLEALFWRGVVEFTKRKLLFIAAGEFAIGFLDETNQILLPGPIDDFGRETKLIIGKWLENRFVKSFSVFEPKLNFILGKLSKSNLAKNTRREIENIAKSLFRGDQLKKVGITTKEKLLGLAQDAFSNGKLIDEVSTKAGQVLKKQIELKNGLKVNFSFLKREGEDKLRELITVTIDGKNKELKQAIKDLIKEAKDLGNDLKK